MSVWIKISSLNCSKAQGRTERKNEHRKYSSPEFVNRSRTRRRTRDSLRDARARWRFNAAVCGLKARASYLSDRGVSRRLTACEGAEPSQADFASLSTTPRIQNVQRGVGRVNRGYVPADPSLRCEDGEDVAARCNALGGWMGLGAFPSAYPGDRRRGR